MATPPSNSRPLSATLRQSIFSTSCSAFVATRSRSTTTQWNYDFAAKQIIATVAPGISYSDSGGKTHIGRYTGTFFDRLTLSALVGRGESNRTTHSSLDHVSRVDDARTGAVVRLAKDDKGRWGIAQLPLAEAAQQREAARYLTSSGGPAADVTPS